MSSQVSKEEWFRSIIAQYEQRLIRYSTRITGSREGAREVVQEAFLRLWQTRDDSLDNTCAWLFRVCRNQAIDTLRRHKKISTVSIESAAAVGIESEKLFQDEPDSFLLAALKKLPENQQEILRLKFQENMSYADISEVTGLSVSNVGYLLHMAIKTLRDIHTSSLQSGTKSKGRV
jgi:RNA polymerase sigma factor (sigma-70 family)